MTAGPSVLLSQGLGSGVLNEYNYVRIQETELVSTSSLPGDPGHFPSLVLTSLWVKSIVS